MTLKLAALLLSVAALSCRNAGPPPCDPERADRLRALLATVPETAPLAAHGAPVCLAPGALSALGEDGVIRLDATLPDAPLAARLAHLLLHARDGTPRLAAATAADCDAAVGALMAAEIRAHALEARLRGALGVSPDAAPQPHPLPALEAAYRARCARPPGISRGCRGAPR